MGMVKAIPKVDQFLYRWLGRENGYTALEQEILFRDLCSGCGACAAVCPEDVIGAGEFPRLIGECTNCGYCLAQCPRAFFSKGEVAEALYGEVSDDPLGSHIEKFGAKTTDPGIAASAQDGGVVTALLSYALERGIIDGAVVCGVSEEEPWNPVPRFVTKPEELEGTSGTRYSNCPNLSALKEAKEKDLKKVAVVGLPCQIEGLRKIQHYPIEEVDLKDRVSLAIAVFCKANFLYGGLMKELVEEKYGVDLQEMRKIDIKGKHVIVATTQGETKIPLEEAHPHRRAGCEVCTDFTGKLADLSVGSVGTPAGYSTVLVRSKAGKQILDGMRKEKALETMELQQEKPGIELIELLQTVKAKDAKRNTRKRIRKVLPLPYRYLSY
jgi:coenzyme F420 hydrogenase subunit beta